MSVSSIDFLNSAKISFDSKTEIGFRNCVSRAYYCIYHKVHDTITLPVPKYTTGGVHHCLVQYLNSKSNGEPHDPTEMRKLSYKVKAAHENRCLADYDLGSFTVDEAFAKQSLLQAESVICICDNLIVNLKNSKTAQ